MAHLGWIPACPGMTDNRLLISDKSYKTDSAKPARKIN
jgi:hypothetical protein